MPLIFGRPSSINHDPASCYTHRRQRNVCHGAAPANDGASRRQCLLIISVVEYMHESEMALRQSSSLKRVSACFASWPARRNRPQPVIVVRPARPPIERAARSVILLYFVGRWPARQIRRREARHSRRGNRVIHCWPSLPMSAACRRLAAALPS